MTRGRWLVVFAVLLSTSTPCASALAEDGVIVDPDSAPGKEYALPLDAARQQGTAEEPREEAEAEAVARTGAPPRPPAFGAGVEPPQEPRPQAPRKRKPRPSAPAEPTEPAAPRPKKPLELVAPSDRLVAIDDGGQAVTISVAVGLGVLLAGLALAAGARRLRPRSG